MYALSETKVKEQFKKNYQLLLLSDDLCAREDDELDPDPISFGPDVVLRALHTSARGAGSGGSRMRTEHLKAIVEGGDSSRLHELILRLVNGRIPAAIRPYLCGGCTTSLGKPSTPERPIGIRPIVVGEAVMRLAGRTLTMVNAARFRATLLPLQFGVGVPGGAEQVIHSTRLAAEQQPEWIVFQSDFQNAFNTISRRLILEQLFKLGYQDLVPYFLCCYGHAAQLSVRMADGTTHWFLSREGVRQGDPLGPFFFAVGLQAVLTALHEEMKKPDALDAVLADYQPGDAGPLRELCTDDNQQSLILDIAALLDDVRLVGPPPVVVFAAQRMKALTTTLCTCLKWNISKCCAWSPEILTETMFDGLSDGSSRICAPQDGIVLLGAPIGSPSFERNWAERKVQSHALLLQQLQSLRSLQVAILLLRYCAAQRINYLLRTIPPLSSKAAAQLHDNQVRETLCKLLKVESITEDKWLQGSLPLSMGGLALGSATKDRKAAYLGSAALCLRKFDESFPDLANLAIKWTAD